IAAMQNHNDEGQHRAIFDRCRTFFALEKIHYALDGRVHEASPLKGIRDLNPRTTCVGRRPEILFATASAEESAEVAVQHYSVSRERLAAGLSLTSDCGCSLGLTRK